MPSDPFAKYGGRAEAPSEDAFAKYGGEKARTQAKPGGLSSLITGQYAQEPAPDLPEFETGEGIGRGLLQGLTFGFGDEIAGGLDAAGQTLISPFTDDERTIGERYRENRDFYRARNERAREQQPVRYTGAEIAGAIASPVPGGAAKARASTGRLAAQGAGLGGLYGLGASEADITQGEIGQAATDTGVGALAGAVIPPALRAAGRGAQRIAAPIAKAAETRGAKALGYIQGELQKRGIGGARGDARVALEEGIVSPLASAETMLGRTMAARTRITQELADLRSAVEGAKGGVDASAVQRRIADALSDFQPGTSVEAAYKKQIQTILDDVAAFADPSGKIPASAIPQLKKVVAQSAYTDALTSTPQLTGQLKPRAARAYGVIREAEQEMFEQFAPALAKDFEGATNAYRSLEAIRKTLSKRIGRDAGNNTLFGLTTQLSAILGGAGGGFAAGGPVGALIGAGLGRLAYQKGDQLTAKAADATAKVLKSRFGPALEKASDPKTVAAVHQALVEFSPEYRRLISDVTRQEPLGRIGR